MMFHFWGWVLAALVGLFVGWLIWGRKSVDTGAVGEADRLRSDLAACQASGREQAARISSLETDLSVARSASSVTSTKAASQVATAASDVASPAAAVPGAAPASALGANLVSSAPAAAARPAKKAAAKPAPAKVAAPKSEAAKSEAAKPAKAATPKAPAKPKTLTAPRGGKADDLKLIKGVGPKMEALLHKLGFFHFDQLAAWSAKDVAWVDENLEDFKGRATREDWVQQAKDLAAGKPPRKGGEN